MMGSMMRRAMLGDGSTLNVDFTSMTNGGQLANAGFTFTNATTTARTYINSSGLVATATTNEPRFDHDPTTRAPRGLLIEGASTNLALRSGDLNTTVTDGTQWIVSGYTRGDVSTTLPDGTTGNACRISGTGSASFRTPSIAVTASTAYTFSFWARNNGGSQARYRVWNATAGSSIVDYTLSGSNYVSQIGGANNTSTTWVRVSVTFTTPVGCTSVFVYPTSSDSGTVDLLLWGAQVEAGSGSSYIPTVASQVTRNADSCVMTGTNFSSWFNSSEGTFTARFQTIYSGQTILSSYILALDNSNSKRIVYMNTGLETAASYDGVTIVSGVGDATGVDARVASAYSTTDRAFVLNGGTVSTGTVAAGYSTGTSLAIGSISTFATFRQIKFYPTRLTNAQLQAITT